MGTAFAKSSIQREHVGASCEDRMHPFDHVRIEIFQKSNYLNIKQNTPVLLAGVSGGFPGVLPFRPTYRLARLYE